MKMKTIYFVRHAESTANTGAVSMEDHLVPLSSKGQKQASRILDIFQVTPSSVYVSELLRTQLTSQPYCTLHNITATVSPFLNEMAVLNYELIKGMTGAERYPLSQKFWEEPDPKFKVSDGSESFIDFSYRVKSFREEMLPVLKDNSVCFTHGYWIKMLIWQMLNYSFISSVDKAKFAQFHLAVRMPNCTVYKVTSFDQNHWSIRQEIFPGWGSMVE